MNLEALYNWQGTIREMLQELGYWQSLTLAMYSLGRVLARQSAPSKVAEKLGMLGKPDTVQRRLERFVDNVRLNWHSCCVAWAWWAYDPKAWPLGQVELIERVFTACCVNRSVAKA